MDSCTDQEDLGEFRKSNPPARELAASALGSLIFYVLLAIIVVVAVPYGTVEPQWEAAFECAVFSLAALWIIESLLRGGGLVEGWRLFVPLVALVVFAFFQVLPLWGPNVAAGVEWRRSISAAPYETRLIAFKLVALTLALALLKSHTCSRRRLRALVYVVIGVGVASALFGILREMTQRGAAGFILPGLKRGMGYGQFINRNHFAFLMEMALGLVLGLIVGRGERRDRLLVLAGVTISLWGALVLSNSRGGIFSMLGQLVFTVLLFAVAQRRKSLRKMYEEPAALQRVGTSFLLRIALVACLVAVAVVGVVWVGGDSLVDRFEATPGEITQERPDVRQGERRMQIWQATLHLIKEHPVMGVGFGAFGTAISKYHDASGVLTPQQTHNDYLELLASGGLIGLVLGTSFVIVLLNATRKRLYSADPFRRAACVGALIGIFGVAVHSLFDFGLHITANALVLDALIVIAIVDGDSKRQTIQQDRDGAPQLQEEFAMN